MNENNIIGPTSFTFQGINWKRFAAGAGVVVAGALLTYVTNWLTGVNFGAYTPIIMSVWSIIANLVRKWVSDNE